MLCLKKVKFSTQADPAVLESLRKMAVTEGRQLQSLVDEALREYIERKQDIYAAQACHAGAWGQHGAV